MDKNKRFLFFLATEKGFTVLQDLTNKGYKNSIGVVISFKEIEMRKDYFQDLQTLCKKNKINFFDWQNVKNRLEEVIKKYHINCCIAIGWRYLLPLYLNEFLETRIMIIHDSLLPKYRGFSPLVTAMLKGDKELGISVIYAEEDADCGDVILQKRIHIEDGLYINQVISIISKLYSQAVIELIDLLKKNNTIKACPQNEKLASYSIWRDEDDYWINWGESAKIISRHIHALGYPYKGAKSLIDGQIIRIFQCEFVTDKKFEIRTPGKIWKINEGNPVIVCGEGMLKLTDVRYENNNKFIFSKIRKRLICQF